MSLSTIEARALIQKAVKLKITEGEMEELYWYLYKKQKHSGLDSYTERTILSGCILYNDLSDRLWWIDERVKEYRDRIVKP